MKFSVVNLGLQTAELVIYDLINKKFWGDEPYTSARDVASLLNSFGDLSQINVRINSEGGSVAEGIAIYNLLKNHPANVTVYVDGFAMSMASGVAMAGDEVVMAANALMMLHNPNDVIGGDSSDMRKHADIMDKIRDALAVAYAEKSGKTNAEIVSMMNDETWLNADEALAAGFADRIGESVEIENDAKATFSNRNLRVPARLSGALVNLLEPSKKEPQKMDNQTPSTPAAPSNPFDERAATVSEIKRLAGIENVGPDFILNQIEKSATIKDVQSALNAELVNQLKLAKDAAAKAAEDAKTNQTPGVDPLNTTNHRDGEPQKTNAQVFADKRETRDELMREMNARNNSGGFKSMDGVFNHAVALNDVKRCRPELFENEPSVLKPV